MSELNITLESLRKMSLPTGVLAIDVSPDGSTVYAACHDGVYAVAANGDEHRKLYAHESYASGVHLDAERHVLISSGYDGQLIWFDLQRNCLFRRVLAHRFWSWQSARSRDGRWIASVTGQYLTGGEKYEPDAEHESSVKVFDAWTGAPVHAFAHQPPVQATCFSHDGQHLAAGNLLGQVRIWRLTDGQLVSDWKTDAFTSWGIIKSHCYIGGIFAMTFTPDDSELLVVGMGPMNDPMAGNGRQLWQRFAWRESPVRLAGQTHEGESGEGLMEAVAHHPQLPYFLMGGRLRGGEWNTAAFASVDGHKLHHMNTNYRLTAARFSADGQRLATAGCDKQKPPQEGKFPDYGVVEVFRCA